MSLIVNAGSKIEGESGKGWTNTAGTARDTAVEWLFKMHEEGMKDVELLEGETVREGRWVFSFRHSVTGKVVELETHGIDDLKAYARENVFDPRIYWNGSSSANPELADFQTKGFLPYLTFVPVED